MTRRVAQRLITLLAARDAAARFRQSSSAAPLHAVVGIAARRHRPGGLDLQSDTFTPIPAAPSRAPRAAPAARGSRSTHGLAARARVLEAPEGVRTEQAALWMEQRTSASSRGRSPTRTAAGRQLESSVQARCSSPPSASARLRGNRTRPEDARLRPRCLPARRLAGGTQQRVHRRVSGMAAEPTWLDMQRTLRTSLASARPCAHFTARAPPRPPGRATARRKRRHPPAPQAGGSWPLPAAVPRTPAARRPRRARGCR